MSVEGLGEPRKVSIEEARKIAEHDRTVNIVWRPEESLPESEQYALIYG